MMPSDQKVQFSHTNSSCAHISLCNHNGLSQAANLTLMNAECVLVLLSLRACTGRGRTGCLTAARVVEAVSMCAACVHKLPRVCMCVSPCQSKGCAPASSGDVGPSALFAVCI